MSEKTLKNPVTLEKPLQKSPKGVNQTVSIARGCSIPGFVVEG
jgi:hypothetical protein